MIPKPSHIFIIVSYVGLLSNDKKIYFINNDDITPKSITFLRDYYPYSGNRDIKKDQYDVPTGIYFLDAFLYDNFVKQRKRK